MPRIRVAALTGATKLAGAISVEWSLTNRFGPAWFLNGENEYNQHVELEPTLRDDLDAGG